MTSHALEGAPEKTGPLGPVSVSVLLFLLIVSPLMRGGNRQVALIVLEAVALLLLVVMSLRLPPVRKPSARSLLIALLALSPVWLAAIYLLPVPAAVWTAAPGRSDYLALLQAAGVAAKDWLPLSLAPDATLASLLAASPLVAAFVAGLALNVQQVRVVFWGLAALAFGQVALGLLQVAGGHSSGLYFGGIGGRPFGTFANPNHFANYVALALAAFLWLAWSALTQRRSRRAVVRDSISRRHALALWTAGAVLLMVGVLMSRSRGATLGGFSAALAALALLLTVGSSARSLKTTFLIIAGVVAAGVALVGVEVLSARFDLSKLGGSASDRVLLASSTLAGAAEFWPLGAGWGTYELVYPRFQPSSLIGLAHHAHHDYAEMLFEGGIFAVLLMAAFGWLAITRALYLIRAATNNGHLRREEMASAVCGIGLLGFLLHSLVEFNMHIPANAIVACLFAGIFLRPWTPKDAEPPSD